MILTHYSCRSPQCRSLEPSDQSSVIKNSSLLHQAKMYWWINNLATSHLAPCIWEQQNIHHLSHHIKIFHVNTSLPAPQLPQNHEISMSISPVENILIFTISMEQEKGPHQDLLTLVWSDDIHSHVAQCAACHDATTKKNMAPCPHQRPIAPNLPT